MVCLNPVCLDIVVLDLAYFKTLNNHPWGLITSPWVVLVVLVLVFVVPGVVFLVLVDVVACHCVYYH